MSKSISPTKTTNDDSNKVKFVKNSSISSSFSNNINLSTSSQSPFKSTNSRKSKLNDNFFVMKEKLEEKMKQSNKKNVSFEVTPIPYDMLEECFRHDNKPLEWSVITLNVETKNIPLGIEETFTPITGANSRKLDAIEIDDIEKDSRIYLDGRFREGDHIKEINGRPVYQMSSQRVKSYFEEMSGMDNPSLTLDIKYEDILLRIEELKNRSNKNKFGSTKSSLPQDIVIPMQSKLQQVNSTLIKSNEKDVKLIKNINGFGFNVTSRFNAQNECLLYVSTVKINSVAYNILEIGDRILKLNDECLSQSSQSEFVSKLKNIPVGEEIILRIARSNNDDKKENEEVEKNQIKKDSKDNCDSKENNVEIKNILLPFNSTPSSGLGISLKARCIHKANGEKQEVGIFVKSTFVGGSAYNSGLLKENDRLIGIEGIDLTQYLKNKQAFEAIANCLSSLDPDKTHVHLKISRIVQKDDESLKNVEIHVDRDYQSNDHLYTPCQPVSPALIRAEKNGITSVTVNDLDNDTLSNYPMEEDDLYFDRQSKARQSISEKRKNVSNNDPSNIELFQKIKHLRQSSAPTTSSTQQFSKYSPSLGVKKIQNINTIENNDDKPLKSALRHHINNESNNKYRPQRSKSSDMTQKKSLFERSKNVLFSSNTSKSPQNTAQYKSKMPTMEKYEQHMYQGPAIKSTIPLSQSFQISYDARKEYNNKKPPPPSYTQTLDRKNNYNRYTIMEPNIMYQHNNTQKSMVIQNSPSLIYHSPLPGPKYHIREGSHQQKHHEIPINNDYYDAFNNYFVASETIPQKSSINNGVNKTKIITMVPEKNFPYLERINIQGGINKIKNVNDSGKSHSVFYYDTIVPQQRNDSNKRSPGVSIKRF
uniref:PDZ domain-containing protein n=1 Tax=Parastrongyloides trichosuri TaxID=131310 RepID=A0A0N5A5L0_PARTI